MSKAPRNDASGKPRAAKAAVPAAAVGAAGAGIGLLVALRPKSLGRALTHLPGRSKPQPTSGPRKLLVGLGRRVESLTSSGRQSNEKAGRARANDATSRRRERKAGRERRRRNAKA